MNSLNRIGEELIRAVGRGGAAELLDAITRAEADRAALIGRLSSRDDAQWLAKILIDLETDQVARLQLAEGLRLALASG